MATKANAASLALVLASLGVVVAVVAREPIVEVFRRVPAAASSLLFESSSRPETVAPIPPPPETVAGPHLRWADRQSQRVIDEHLKPIDIFFADAKTNTRLFAEKALSWGSKWRLVADYVPFTKGGRHETFIRDKFEEYVFKPADLEVTTRHVVDSYLKHVESIEGQMLVRIRADVADFSSAYKIAQMDERMVRASYDEALMRAMEATGSSLRADIGTELVSLISGQVLTQVAVRLGVSAGILATGAGSSWATFGIGLVVGVIVDQIVSWVWNWYADPKGNLAEELDAKLDEINRLIVDGSGDVRGLRDRLRSFAKERAKVRRQAVLNLLQSH